MLQRATEHTSSDVTILEVVQFIMLLSKYALSCQFNL